jgi:LCP family protein required for cell wall assembly
VTPLPPPFELRPARRRAPALRLLLFCFLGGVAIVPVAAGALLYFALTGAFDNVSLVSALTLLKPPAPVPAPAPAAPPAPAPNVELPEWSSHGRVNVLLMGVDKRDSDKDPLRTDTMMVLTIDTEAHTAGLLSLPRDLWVEIPGHGTERINAAYEIGESLKAGGGPDLARKTVEQFLGVPIQHYVVVGFQGFQRLVDQLGGVVVDVERPIKDDEYPDGDYGLRRIYFQPGPQRLTGETALWYVRTRHADSDFGRARRQQQLLLGLRKQALQLNLLPKAPGILSALSDTIKTDLRPAEILGLVRVAKDIDTSSLTNRVIDESMTTNWVTPAGAQVLLPDRAAVRRLVQEVFGTQNAKCAGRTC